MKRFKTAGILLASVFAFTAFSGCSAKSPKELCEKHAKSDEVEECTKGMEMIKEAIGDDHWKEFSKCADSAGDKSEMDKCLTEDMEKAMQEHFKKKLEGK